MRHDKIRIVMNVPGIHNVHNALAASAVAICSGFSENEIRDGLETFSSYDKRMQVVQSGKVTILNDSYNANPDSYHAALQTLEHIATQNKSRKIVVFGDMLELGLKSESYHQELFFNLLDYNIDAIFTLGEESKVAGDLLRDRGYENIFSFNTHEELGKKLNSFIDAGDIILIKGSRGMLMEKVLAFL